jgi:hypothetical protein
MSFAMPDSLRPVSAPRAALTLVELIIAMGILLAVIASAMNVVTGTYGTTAMTEAKDRLNREAVDIVNLMSDDLGQSTWLYFDNTTPGGPFIDTTATALESSTDDSTKAYYPYVQLQNNGAGVGGLNTLDFPHTQRPASMVALPALPSNLPGSAADATTLFTPAGRANFLSSFHARSQELLFIKLTSAPWTSDPAAQAPNSLVFSAGDWSGTDQSAANRTAIGVLYPSGWAEVRNGAGDITGYSSRQPNPLLPPYGVRLTATDVRMINSEPVILPNYETIDVPDYTPPTAGAADQSPREYTYAVVPSPIGLGRLVRAYSVRKASYATLVAGTNPGQFISDLTLGGANAMVVDRVLSDNCVRIVMDTYRTEPRIAGQAGLGVYDIRVRLYMAKRSSASSKLVIYRTLESVLTMRGRTSEVDRTNDATKLGATPFDLTY